MSNWIQHTNLKQRLADIAGMGSSGNEVLAGADFTWFATIAAGLNPAIVITADNPLSVVDTHAFVCHEVRVSGQWFSPAGVVANPTFSFLYYGLQQQLQFNIKADGRKRDIFDADKSFGDIMSPAGVIIPLEFHMKFNPGEKLSLRFQINGTWQGVGAATPTVNPLLVGVSLTGEYIEASAAGYVPRSNK